MNQVIWILIQDMAEVHKKYGNNIPLQGMNLLAGNARALHFKECTLLPDIYESHTM